MKVYDSTCKNCLLSEDSIVSPKRRKEIIKGCATNQQHFICHKATMEGDEDICCRNFYDKLGHLSQLVRMAERLGVVKFVPQPDAEKLPTWQEMEGRKKKLK